MKLLLANHSTYPRLGDRPDREALRNVLLRRERGRVPAAELESVYAESLAQILADQANAELDWATDGGLFGDDLASRAALTWSGVKPGPWRRFFESDFFYRVPTVTGAVRRRRPSAAEDYGKAAAASPARVKAVLMGPYTLGVLCDAPSVRARRKAMEGFAEALAAEVADLEARGAAWIQVEEPALLRAPQDADWAERLLTPLLRRRGRAKILLATYFAPAAKLYPRLCRMPVDGLALDFTADADDLTKAVLHHGAPKPLGLGLLDGRETRLERLPDLLDRLERLRRVLLAPENFLMPSCGLEFLPRDKARAKLARMQEARGHFQARVSML
jgi:5-methyltetrahydropteroyltriglutamate--homocysteine methyltransferase